jgi:hypothetical protein
MECREVQKLLIPFADNELDVHNSFTVAEHLDQCPTCLRDFEVQRKLDNALRAVGQTPLEGVEEFRQVLRQRLVRKPWPRRWLGLGIAAVAVLLLTMGHQNFSADSAGPEASAFCLALVAEQKNAGQLLTLPWLRDPEKIRDLLRREGLMDIPNLGPAGFHLDRARVSRPLGYTFIRLVYHRGRQEICLFVSRRWSRPLIVPWTGEGLSIIPLGVRAVFLAVPGSLPDLTEVRQLAEEEVNTLTA